MKNHKKNATSSSQHGKVLDVAIISSAGNKQRQVRKMSNQNPLDQINSCQNVREYDQTIQKLLETNNNGGKSAMESRRLAKKQRYQNGEDTEQLRNINKAMRNFNGKARNFSELPPQGNLHQYSQNRASLVQPVVDF